MSFTFEADLSDEVSQVRQLLGDTVDTGHRVEDETIDAYLPQKGVISTASQLAYDLAARYAVMVDMEVDNQNNKASQLSAQYEALGKRLEAQAASKAAADASGFCGVYVGGIGDNRGADVRFPAEYEWPYV